MKRLCVVLLLLAAVPAVMNGQAVATSQITGTVKDATGALLPGAEVKVTQTTTGYTRDVLTSETGSYSLPSLPIGPYRLEVAMTGFNTYVQTGIVLQVNSNPAIQVTLQVGSISETIAVEANAAMVETQSTALGQVVDTQRVAELPLNGRNVAQLISLIGAAVVGTGGLRSNLNHADAVAYSIGGGLINATNFVLDGGNHVDPRTNIGMPLPFPDAMQEFKVETSALPANYGSQPGGAVNVVTKSGTNALHGNAFWFLRNGAMNARNFFASVRDSLKRNQFGGTVGGPIVRDKLFFFAGIQQTFERTSPATTTVTVPTQEVLNGDFRTVLSTQCRNQAINLPATLGGAPFANNNQISPSLFNPVALNYLKLIPVSTNPCGRLLFGIPQQTNASQLVGRMDWRRTSSDQIFGRYYITDTDLKAYLDPKNVLANSLGLPNRVQSFIIGDTHVINQSTVSSLRISYARSAIQRVGAEGIPTFQELGANIHAPIKNYAGQNAGATGYFERSSIPGYVYTNVYGITEDIGMTLRTHQLSFGGEWLQTQMNALGPFQMNPRITFNGQVSGDALVDFMTGKVFQILQGGGQVGREVRNAPSLYFQDNWKMKPNFQVNLGLRWDPFLPHHSRYGYAMRFDRAKFDAKVKSKVYVNSPAGLSFIGDEGFDGKSNTEPMYALFSPRIGLVFDPRGKGTESIRAGYGIFYGSSYLWSTMHVPLNPPWGNTVTANTPTGGLTNPWSDYPGGNPFPRTADPKNFIFPIAGQYKFESSDNKATYVQQWNLSLQKQVGASLLLSAAYMGNKTTHQLLGVELNPAVYIPGSCVAGQYGLTQPGPCSQAGNINARRVLNLADPENGKYFGVLQMTEPNGNASYNGLLLTANRRFANNFSATANYTWSHCLNQGEPGQDIVNFYQDPANRRGEWGDCNQDRRHLVNASVVARTPSMGEGVARKLLSNWGVSGIYTFSSGIPLNLSTGRDAYLGGFGNQRPDLIGDPHLDEPTIARWFNTAAFRPNAAGTFGNVGRTIQLYGPSRWNADMALWRSFAMHENVKMDFRVEAFNVFNHTRFENPTANSQSLSSTDFGRLTTALDPRILQLALKFAF